MPNIYGFNVLNTYTPNEDNFVSTLLNSGVKSHKLTQILYCLVQ